MKPDRLLYLSTHQLAAFHWQAGKLTAEGVFPTSEEGHHAFSAYLALHGHDIFALLANVAEEGFQVETIPFLRGSDRTKVVRRKLEQLFFNAPLTASYSLGFKKSKRKDERILFAALTNNESFAPWLAALRSAGVALAGLYSLPLVAPTLLKKLKIAEPHCLLLSVQDQSMRQSYFENGELVFSRLTPLSQSSIGGIAQTFATETIKLQQYLASQRIIGRDQPITAHILVHPGVQKVIEGKCVDTQTVHFNFLDLLNCARLTGLKTLPTGSHASSDADLLFLNLLATSPPPMQFANDDQRHGYHLRLIRFSSYMVGAIALAGGLLFAGAQVLERYAIDQEVRALGSEAVQARQRYEDIVRSFPAIPTSSETLIQVINRYVELEKTSASPDGLFHEISRALTLAPLAQINDIDWQVGGKTEPGSATGATALTVAGASESALVQGQLGMAAEASARDVLVAFDGFVAALKSNPLLQIDVLQRPVDIDSGKSLRGGDLHPADNPPRTFSLRITRKPGP